ncbi:hypothetical protein Desaci_1314 [Desulfosporosinus acidiphilus SJ4]|uniref:DUF2577 domain-containing protein n=1 Tax=Desulfosporosinus acidiphilus (strain DSM 22704 / JCM 16185 / SJ4) TaxID=646529 RepID=I4D3G6_DESAJ|nr:DUF2577 domain-containing protein [Desulfosporosinus acidiphilus]AFM40340.1 hypothetical protein Desaci_1314 [Desulfosporosinus acidiphilus SJ4]
MRSKNPYSEMIKIMQDQGAKYNPFSVQLATVIATSPLTITAGELQLAGDNLLVADFLLTSYSRQINLPSPTVSGTTSDGTITSLSIPNATLNFTDGLNVGDTLAVVQVDSSTFVILARVVSV